MPKPKAPNNPRAQGRPFINVARNYPAYPEAGGVVVQGFDVTIPPIGDVTDYQSPWGLSPSYISVIPGMAGFGMETTAGANVTRNGISAVGSGGTTIRYVTNRNASGAGSLAQAISDHNSGSGGTTIVFDVGGTIDLNYTDMPTVTRGHLTIAGQTAPPPGIQIIRGRLNTRTSDVLVQHLRIRQGAGTTDRDAMTLLNATNSDMQRVVIDHCSLQYGTDENADLYTGGGTVGAYRGVTYANCIFSDPLGRQFNTPYEQHAYNLLFGGDGGRVENNSIIGCLMVNAQGRSPTLHARSTVLMNNMIHGWGTWATQLTDGDNGDNVDGWHYDSLVGNKYVAGPFSGLWAKYVWIDSAVHLSSKVWMEDNAAYNASGGLVWEGGTVAQQYANLASIGGGPVAILPPANIGECAEFDGMVWLSADAAEALVLSHVGCRPGETRDAVDQKAITNWNNRTGQVIDWTGETWGEAGQINLGYAFPAYASTSTSHTDIPANPDTIQPSGYTALEEWLHGKLAEVEL